MASINSVVSLVASSHTPLATGVLAPTFLLSPVAGNVLKGDATYGGVYITANDFGDLVAGSGSIPPVRSTADIGSISAVANAATVQQINSTWTVGGTATAVAMATTTPVTKLRRVNYIGAATANTTAGVIQNSGSVLAQTIGMSAHFSTIVSVSSATNVSTATGFFGLQNGAVFATGFTPVTKTNCFGIGYDPASANLRMYVAGTAAATAVDLGTNFPRGFNSSDAYKITLYVCSDAERISTTHYARWHVAKIGSPTITASGVITAAGTLFPANTLFLSPTVVTSSMATAAASSISLTNVTFAITTT